MRVVKCQANHFFDADKYSVCPQCGAAMGSSVESSSGSSSQKSAGNSSDSSGKGGLSETFGVFKKNPFKSHKKDVDSGLPKASAGNDNYEKLKSFNSGAQTNNSYQPALNPNSLLGGGFVPTPAPVSAPAPVTEPEPAPVSVPAEPAPVEPSVAPAINTNVATVEEKVAPVAQPVNVQTAPAQEVSNTSSSSEDSLLEEIKKVTSDNDGKTVGFFSSGKSSQASETDDSSSVVVPCEEPVVGWLVCIEGPNIGQCFNIYAGKNSLGRSSNNRIVINKDRSISREKHSWIIYEPKHREFFAQPGESSGLTYVNDENIMQATKLEKWSTIDVGNTRLTLVPLCDSEFSWETYL